MAQKLLSLIALGLLLTLNTASAATRTAASCASAEVQRQVDAAVDGDVVAVPACNAENTADPQSTNARWSTAVVINEKRITVRGAGIDSTVLRLQGGHYIFYIPSTNTKLVDISGFTFTENPAFSCDYNTAPNGQCAPIKISGGNGFLVHDNKFLRGYSGSGASKQFVASLPSGIYVNLNTSGVIYQNTFWDMGPAVYPYGKDSTAAVAGSAWSQPTNLGDGNILFVEQNTILGGDTHCVGIEAEDGASYVFRYNTVTGCQGAGGHGPCQSGGRGTRRTEVYHNTITSGGNNNWVAIYVMGGTGVMFGNTLVGWSDPIIFQYKRSCQAQVDSSCLGQYKTLCDNVTESPRLDQNLDGTGWPCLDQPGRGMNQQSEPYYEWNNCTSTSAACTSDSTLCCNSGSLNANPYVNTGWCPEIANHIKSGRDFISDQIPAGYTPYPYPHPLRSGGTSTTTSRASTTTTPSTTSSIRTTTISTTTSISAVPQRPTNLKVATP